MNTSNDADGKTLDPDERRARQWLGERCKANATRGGPGAAPTAQVFMISLPKAFVSCVYDPDCLQAQNIDAPYCIHGDGFVDVEATCHTLDQAYSVAQAVARTLLASEDESLKDMAADADVAHRKWSDCVQLYRRTIENRIIDAAGAPCWSLSVIQTNLIGVS